MQSLLGPEKDDDCARSRSFTLLLLSYIAGAADDGGGDEDFSGDPSAGRRKKVLSANRAARNINYIFLNMDARVLYAVVLLRHAPEIEGSGSPVGGSPCDCVGWKRRRPSDVRKLLWDDRQREPGGEEGMEGIK